MTAALGRMWLADVDVDWDLGGPAEHRRRVPLPTYPFQRERHWVGQSGTVASDPAPSAAGPELAAPGPKGTPEEVIRQIWVDLLGIGDIGPDQDFFSLGGHSLLGTKVVARIREAFGADLPASAVFETPTVNGLAAAVKKLLAAQPQPGDLAGLLAEIKALSPAQVRHELSETQGENLP
jgi:phthiocerol/phenolphthiocerol synthesis type-I polyketide synthase E